MRNVILVCTMAVMLAVGTSAVFAGPPVNGTYRSSAPWSQFDEGREGSSWPGANGFLSAGNVLHAESWDGSALGGDWKVLCPVANDVQLIYSMVIGGTGQEIWMIKYVGGYVELGGAGPWGGGDAVYTGVINTYIETRTLQFDNYTMVGSVSDHTVEATIQGYPKSCVSFGIGNGVWRGNSNSAPSGYPGYRDANCNASSENGHWGDIRDLTVTVQGCAVSTQPATWGTVKSLYR